MAGAYRIGVLNPTLTYNNNGNMLTGAGRTMTYTSFDLPSTIAQGTISAEILYNAFHQRYKMCTPNCTAAAAMSLSAGKPAKPPWRGPSLLKLHSLAEVRC